MKKEKKTIIKNIVAVITCEFSSIKIMSMKLEVLNFQSMIVRIEILVIS